MTASITHLSTFVSQKGPRASSSHQRHTLLPYSLIHDQQKVIVMPHIPQGPSAEDLLVTSTTRLARLLVHCANEGMRPKDVEEMIAPPLRIALDYCIPDVVHQLLSNHNDPVPLSRQSWVAAQTKAIFGRFSPESEDDIYFLIEQLDKAYEEIHLELHQRESFPGR